MKAREFCYWLQGMFELSNVTNLDIETTKKIKNHLDMVFIHDIDPSYPEGVELDKAHNGFERPPTMRC